MICWICGAHAGTVEHKTKKSDLRAALKSPTPKSPLFYSDATRRNVKIAGLDNPLLTWQDMLCAKCNNERTQPDDRAWEQMSGRLRERMTEAGNTRLVLPPSDLFAERPAANMLGVHRFFLKLLGCAIVANSARIATKPLARVLMDGGAHPGVYLKLGHLESIGMCFAGMSELQAQYRDNGSCACAAFFYEVGPLAVLVMLAAEGEQRDGLVGAWHPRMGLIDLVIDAL